MRQSSKARRKTLRAARPSWYVPRGGARVSVGDSLQPIHYTERPEGQAPPYSQANSKHVPFLQKKKKKNTGF